MKQTFIEWGISLLLLSFVYYIVFVAVYINAIDHADITKTDLRPSGFGLLETNKIDPFFHFYHDSMFLPLSTTENMNTFLSDSCADGE